MGDGDKDTIVNDAGNQISKTHALVEQLATTLAGIQSTLAQMDARLIRVEAMVVSEQRRNARAFDDASRATSISHVSDIDLGDDNGLGGALHRSDSFVMAMRDERGRLGSPAVSERSSLAGLTVSMPRSPPAAPRLVSLLSASKLGGSLSGSARAASTQPNIFACAGTLYGHKGPVWAVVRGSTHLYSGSSDGQIRVWNLPGRCECTHVLDAHQGGVFSLVYRKTRSGGPMLFSGGADGSVAQWSVHTFTEKKRVQVATDSTVAALCLVPDDTGRQLLFVGLQAQILVIDATTLEPLARVLGLSHWVRAFCHDTLHGGRIISGSHNALHIWSTRLAEQPPPSVGHLPQPQVGERLPATLTCLFTVRPEPALGSVFSLAIYKRLLLVGTRNQNVTVIDLNTLLRVHQIVAHIGIVHAVGAIGANVYTASNDGQLRMWQVSARQSDSEVLCKQVIRRHQGGVLTACTDRTSLFTGGEDCTIKIYMEKDVGENIPVDEDHKVTVI